MHHFDPVAVSDHRGGPIRPADYFPVVLDRDALARQRKKIEQPVKRDLTVDPFLFSVQRYLH
jgi:hypothetical protein